MTVHYLKTCPEFFEEIRLGNKTFELRKADRKFNIGDVLILQEWKPTREEYTGRILARTITFLLFSHDGAFMPSFGLEPGYVAIGMK